MARVKRALNAQKKRRTVLKASKGYRGQRSRLYRKAKEQQLHSLTYAYRDRRARKGEFRKLWISRINAAARANDITYNRLIQGLKAAGVEVDRKNLAEIAVSDAAAFTALVEVAKAALPSDVNAPSTSSTRPPDAHRAFCPRGSCGQTAAPHRAPPRRTLPCRGSQPRRGRVAARTSVSEVFATEAALDRFGALLADAPVQLVTERAAKALSDTVTPVGLVAVCRLPEVSLDEVLATAPRLIAVPVQISEPGNAGTLIRAADAMGADAVVLAGNSVDPYNSRRLRASAGSIFSVPVISEPDEAATVARLQAAGLQVLATTIDGEANLDHIDLDAAHGLAVRP